MVAAGTHAEPARAALVPPSMAAQHACRSVSDEHATWLSSVTRGRAAPSASARSGHAAIWW